MLAKLLKYDFKALNRIMLPLQGGVLLAGLAGVFFTRLTYVSINNSITNSVNSYYSASSSSSIVLEGVVYSTSILLAIVLFTAVIASFWVSLLLIARNYYQSFLRDEGYLTFTLPVTVSQNLLSKIIAGSAWLLVNVIIICLAFLLLIAVGFADAGFKFLGDILSEALDSMGTLPGVVLLTELVILGILALLHAILQVFISLNIGAVLAKTHKVLAGIGIFLAINMGMQTIMSIVTFGMGFTFDSAFFNYSDLSWFFTMQAIVLPPIVVIGGLTVLYYFLSRNLLTNRLNLD